MILRRKYEKQKKVEKYWATISPVRVWRLMNNVQERKKPLLKFANVTRVSSFNIPSSWQAK